VTLCARTTSEIERVASALRKRGLAGHAEQANVRARPYGGKNVPMQPPLNEVPQPIFPDPLTPKTRSSAEALRSGQDRLQADKSNPVLARIRIVCSKKRIDLGPI
jgi:hypothetical protein